jgi:hypothetical protein
MSEPTEKPRGGARRNAGRNTELPAGETVTQSTVMLDDMTRRKAKVLGRGNLSMGLRFAAGTPSTGIRPTS